MCGCEGDCVSEGKCGGVRGNAEVRQKLYINIRVIKSKSKNKKKVLMLDDTGP